MNNEYTQPLGVIKEINMEWIIENKEWIFSGIGVFILGLLITFFVKKNKSQNQRSGNESVNIQVGGDFNINEDKDDK